MNKIWFFGDSNTNGYNKSYWWANAYVKWKGYEPNFWPEILANKLELPFENCSKGGSDNYTILDSIIKQIDNIKDGDYIIIGWSSITRFRLADTSHNFFHTVVLNHFPDLPLISERTLQEILVNRDSELFLKEIKGWMTLLNHTFKNNKIFYWSLFPEFQKCKIVNNLFWSHHRGKMEIANETNGEIDDHHLSEFGCKVLADIMFNYINNNGSKLI
jgi:hypothetical protein